VTGVALGATVEVVRSEAAKPARVFKTAWFTKAARKAHIPDEELCSAIQQVLAGQVDFLGGGVFKKRLRKNQYRSIIWREPVTIGSKLSTKRRCGVSTHLALPLLLYSNPNRSKSCGSVFGSVSQSSPVTSIPANQRLRNGRLERSSRVEWRSSCSRLLRSMVWKRWSDPGRSKDVQIFRRLSSNHSPHHLQALILFRQSPRIQDNGIAGIAYKDPLEESRWKQAVFATPLV
jgi:RelE toxin of RelE / RelB toxin-antitoxin system